MCDENQSKVRKLIQGIKRLPEYTRPEEDMAIGPHVYLTQPSGRRTYMTEPKFLYYGSLFIP